MNTKFTIQTKSGKYRVQCRPGYSRITSQKTLVEAIQKSITHYRSMKNNSESWNKYADRIQEMLDTKDFIAISSLFGMFSWKQKLDN